MCGQNVGQTINGTQSAKALPVQAGYSTLRRKPGINRVRLQNKKAVKPFFAIEPGKSVSATLTATTHETSKAKEVEDGIYQKSL
jgi:hypothetical protein